MELVTFDPGKGNPGSFSILYRIELGGTSVNVGGNHAGVIFQYPLSDRVGWNYQSAVVRRGRFGLSVSSIGSSWVERGSPAHGIFAQGSFSILYRIELGGTGTHPKPIFLLVLLSVSSIGSSWVELKMALTPLETDINFQYPLSDRVGWNDADFWQVFDCVDLSVSSIGSSWVELDLY